MKLLILKHETEYILGMGDVIDCVSLICQLAKKETILFPCFGNYVANIKSFFPHGCNVQLVGLRDIKNHMHELISQHETLVIHSDDMFIADNNLKGHTDIAGLYLKAGLNYAERDKYCPISLGTAEGFQGYQHTPSERPCAFIPEGGSPQLNGFAGYKIDRKYVGKGLIEIVPWQTTMMMQWVNQIREAAEIHCHVTSWWRLIDKLPTRGKLFMHHYARECRIRPDEFEFRKKWEQII